jgi:hypothetical protein
VTNALTTTLQILFSMFVFTFEVMVSPFYSILPSWLLYLGAVPAFERFMCLRKIHMRLLQLSN